MAMRLSRKNPEAQRGISFISLLILFALGGAIVLLALKIVPAYTDYFLIKKIITQMGTSDEVRGGTVADIRKSFDRRMSADYSETLKGEDLDITKEGNETVVSATWSKRIPLITNHTLVIDFTASTAAK
jgi:hypothetical protein